MKFTLFVCSWVVILSLALPFGLNSSLNRFLDILSKTVSPEALQQIQNFHHDVFRVYAVALLIAVGILFWLCIILSHRIAGPVYRIQSALERWKRGNVEHHLALRKDDHFKALADAYNEAAQEFIELRNQVRKSCQSLEEISREMDVKHRTQVQELIGDLQCGIEKKS